MMMIVIIVAVVVIGQWNTQAIGVDPSLCVYVLILVRVVCV